jgi:predicted O-methyltransferase YrrM
MKSNHNTPTRSWISTPEVKKYLESLYADAYKNDMNALKNAHTQLGDRMDSHPDFYKMMNTAYLPIPPDFGNLLYSIARTSRAETIVEFGTSFGISTIFLASALRDNGKGKLITTEFEAGKAERAKKNIHAVGLSDWVEFRVGNALETLKANPPQSIDLILLDGAKGLYQNVLDILEPQIRPGGIIASDNTDMDGLDSFLAYIRNPANGYTSSAITTSVNDRVKAHELTVRV